MSGETEATVSAWTVDSLHEHLLMMLNEVDRRHEQRFLSQERAVLKAEAAFEKRMDQVNEFRGQLKDQQATFATAEKVSDLASRLDRIEGKALGLNAGWIAIGQAVALVASIVAIVVVLAR